MAMGNVSGKVRSSFGGKLGVDSADRPHGEDRQSPHVPQSARLVHFAAWRPFILNNNNHASEQPDVPYDLGLSDRALIETLHSAGSPP